MESLTTPAMRLYILLIAALITGCGQHRAALPTITPYRMDIQQGNAVTPKMMMQLRPGMTKSQVRFILGTPLLVDSFHADRWDYFYQMRKEGRIIEQRRIILEFAGDALQRVRGDVIPATGTPDAMTVEPLKEPGSSSPDKRQEKGLLDRLKFWEGDDNAEKVKPAPEQKPVTAPAATPPITEETPPVSRLPEIAPQTIPETLPPLMEAAPTPEALPMKKAAPVAKPVEPQSAPKGEPKAAPQPVAKPVEPERVRAAPAEEVKPIKPKAVVKPVEPKTAPAPANDLPPEDAPDFFEKMLEKIGF